MLTKLDIINSVFFGSLSISFNSRVNCILGGRGVGKTTILEFIRYCLNIPTDNTEGVVNSNLGEDGYLVLHLLKDKVEYQLQRSRYDFKVKVNGEYDPQFTITELNRKISTFSPNELNDIASDHYKTASFLERLCLQNNYTKINDIESYINAKSIEIRKNLDEFRIDVDSAEEIYSKLKEKKEVLNNKKQNFTTYYKSVQDSIPENLKDTVDDIEKTYSKLSESKAVSLELRSAIRTAQEVLGQIESLVSKLYDAIQLVYDMEIKLGIKLDDYAQISDFFKQFYDLNIVFIDKILKIYDNNNLKINELSSLYSNLLDRQKEYKNKLNIISSFKDEITSLENEIKSIESVIENRKKRGADLANICSELYDNLDNLDILRKDTLNRVISEISINEEFIAAELNSFSDDIVAKDLFRNGLRGSGIRYNAVVDNMFDIFTVREIQMFLITFKFRHDDDVYNSYLNLFKENLQNPVAGVEILNYLATNNVFFVDFITLIPKGLGTVYLKLPKSHAGTDYDYKPSMTLSLGQKCTTLLPLVFALPSNIMLFDQPEDNLDNYFIATKIAPRLKSDVKCQYILVTHNANIPVLSECMTCIFFDDLHINNREFVSVGPFESKNIVDRIINKMEGGRDAFKMRETLYNGK